MTGWVLKHRTYLWGVCTVALAVTSAVVTAQEESGTFDYSDPTGAARVEATARPATPIARRPQQLTSGFGFDSENGGDTTPSPQKPPLAGTHPPITATTAPTATTERMETAQPSFTPLPPLSKTVENLKWEASLAENSYGLDKSESSNLALLVAYERLLGPLCMPDLHRTLTYAGSPTDPRCLEYIDKIVVIDPENPIVLCTRDGIDAKSCRSAFGLQRVETFIPGRSTTSFAMNTPKPTDALNEQLAVSSVESKVQPLLNQIKLLEYQLQSNRSLSPEDSEKLVKAYHEGLNLTCRLSRLELRNSGPTGFALGKTPTRPTLSATPTQPPLFPGLATGTKRKNPFDEVLEQFGGPSATPQAPPSGNSPIRIRKVTNTCLDFVNRALRFDRTMALPVCYRDGFYSPSCIDARRKERDGSKSTTGSGASGKPPSAEGSAHGGFSTF